MIIHLTLWELIKVVVKSYIDDLKIVVKSYIDDLDVLINGRDDVLYLGNIGCDNFDI